MKKLFSNIIILVTIVTTSSCSGQTKTNFFDKQMVFTEWKRSLLNAADSVLKYESMNDYMKYFKADINQIDSSIFNAALDTLWKYDKGKLPNHYIVINTFEGEIFVLEVILRAYGKSKGVEAHFFVAPDDRPITSNKFLPDTPKINSVYEKLHTSLFDRAGHMLILSLFENGSFTTQLFSVDNIEKSHVVDEFLEP